MKIPLAKPEVLEDDIAAVTAVLRSGRLSQGPVMREFEWALAAYLDMPHAVVVNSGTSALQLALRALDIKENDEVILPSFSFMAVTNAILTEKAIPVFVDIDPSTLNLDPSRLEAALSGKTRAVVLVHSFGIPAPVAEIVAFARQHSLAVIEDACEALGAEIDGRKVGTFGDIATLAFYPNKVITTGEGGALITHSAVLAARLRSLRNQGRCPGEDWLQHHEPGFSYRLSDIHCALGLQQLSRIEETLRHRDSLACSYASQLNANQHVSCFGTRPGGRISWFTYPVLLSSRFSRQDRDEIWVALRQKGIEISRYFSPAHLQPALRNCDFRCGNLTHTISSSERLLCLPMFNELTDEQIRLVCSFLDEAVCPRSASANIHARAS
jgi:dTDP-4-amino-4,6-dideoxygalactose transaminase